MRCLHFPIDIAHSEKDRLLYVFLGDSKSYLSGLPRLRINV